MGKSFSSDATLVFSPLTPSPSRSTPICSWGSVSPLLRQLTHIVTVWSSVPALDEGTCDPILYKLDLGVNLAKSDLVPSQDCAYVGVSFRMMEGILLPPPDRLETANLAILSLLSSQTWLPLLGTLSLLVPVAWATTHLPCSCTFAFAVSSPLGHISLVVNVDAQ